jgi:hypothetical protein
VSMVLSALDCLSRIYLEHSRGVFRSHTCAASGLNKRQYIPIERLNSSTFLPFPYLRCLTLVYHQSLLTSSRSPHIYNVHTRRGRKTRLFRIGVCPRQSSPLRSINTLCFVHRCLLCGPDRHLAQGRQRIEPHLPRGSPHHARGPPFDSRLDRCDHRRERVFCIHRELCLESFRFCG